MRPRSPAEALLLVIPALLLANACIDPQSTRCGDLWCPTGSACTRDQTRCVSLAQLDACHDKQDEAACKIKGVAEALCIDGVCSALICSACASCSAVASCLRRAPSS